MCTFLTRKPCRAAILYSLLKPLDIITVDSCTRLDSGKWARTHPPSLRGGSKPCQRPYPGDGGNRAYSWTSFPVYPLPTGVHGSGSCSPLFSSFHSAHPWNALKFTSHGSRNWSILSQFNLFADPLFSFLGPVYMEVRDSDRWDNMFRVTPPKRVTLPNWGPPPPCKQALS